MVNDLGIGAGGVRGAMGLDHLEASHVEDGQDQFPRGVSQALL